VQRSVIMEVVQLFFLLLILTRKFLNQRLDWNFANCSVFFDASLKDFSSSFFLLCSCFRFLISSFFLLCSYFRFLVSSFFLLCSYFFSMSVRFSIVCIFVASTLFLFFFFHLQKVFLIQSFSVRVLIRSVHLFHYILCCTVSRTWKHKSFFFSLKNVKVKRIKVSRKNVEEIFINRQEGKHCKIFLSSQ
jgi:hypothetical protein